MNIKLMSALALTIAMLAGYIFFAQQNQRDDANFIVGTAAGYAPFVSINPSGEYEGFDIDVARELAAAMGKKLVLKDLGSMTALFTALDQGSIDAIIWGISITQERLAKVAMVHYQGAATTNYPLLFWQQIPDDLSSFADMHGLTICVEPTSAQDNVVRKYDGITRLPVEKVDDALLNLQYGKVDAALVEQAIAQKFSNKFPEIMILNVSLAPEDQEQGVGIVIKKENQELVAQVQNAVDMLKASGVLAQLEQRWKMLP